MGEYQFYEFAAIDDPLSEKDMDALRRITTRATITPTSLVNSYQYGSFKGDPDALMERYFDAMVYVANWGEHTLKLRLPRASVDVTAIERFEAGQALTVRKTKTHVVVTLTAADEDGGWDDEYGGGQEWMRALLPLRKELMAGDLTALSIGWLCAAYQGDLEGDDREPAPPVGLKKPTRAQKRLVDFLAIDDALIAAAAKGVAAVAGSAVPSRKDFGAWLATLTAKEKDALLVKAALDDDATVGATLLRKYRQAQPKASAGGAKRGRTVRELRDAAGYHDEDDE